MTEEQIEEIDEINPQDYPNLIERVKAMVADVAVILAFMFGATFVFSLFGEVSDNVRIATFLFIFILYDPLFTSFSGGTIGHKMNNLAVRREDNESRNINFVLALIRFAFKSFLGIISLLTVTGNAKRRAIHDMVVGSVVVYGKK